MWDVGTNVSSDTVLDDQRAWWDKTFSQQADKFGAEPSAPARKAAQVFKEAGIGSVLELGAGQGRDTLFFAGDGLRVCALDYSEAGVSAITERAHRSGLSDKITARLHDIRDPLPFPDASFDGCYAHMLFCMALTMPEIERLSRGVRRVLRPGGLSIYTVRNTSDPHYGKGIHRGEEMYEVDGVIVHFFRKETVEHLAQGYRLVGIEQLEEGGLPRRLFQVTLTTVADPRDGSWPS